MPEPQANGRNLRYSPMKGENNDEAKLQVPSKHQLHMGTAIHSSPSSSSSNKMFAATMRKKEFRA